MENTSNEPTKFQLIINVDDEEDLKDYAQVNALNSDLWQFYSEIRSWYKHGLPENITTPQEAIEHIRDRFYDLLGQYVD